MQRYEYRVYLFLQGHLKEDTDSDFMQTRSFVLKAGLGILMMQQNKSKLFR